MSYLISFSKPYLDDILNTEKEIERLREERRTLSSAMLSTAADGKNAMKQREQLIAIDMQLDGLAVRVEECQKKFIEALAKNRKTALREYKKAAQAYNDEAAKLRQAVITAIAFIKNADLVGLPVSLADTNTRSKIKHAPNYAYPEHIEAIKEIEAIQVDPAWDDFLELRNATLELRDYAQGTKQPGSVAKRLIGRSRRGDL